MQLTVFMLTLATAVNGLLAGLNLDTALIELREGETVLDLGFGGGHRCAALRAPSGPTGFAYGVDMTDEIPMLLCFRAYLFSLW